jgi:ParE toxin of type II toxin-antitoxin system, parDE
MEKRDATLNRWCMKQSSVWWVTTNGLSAKSKKAWRKPKVAKCWNMRKLPRVWKRASSLMQLRWTSAAADDLENIANYLFERTPENAARLIREICDAPSALKSFPNRGRAGKKEGTRELVMPSLPKNDLG